MIKQIFKPDRDHAHRYKGAKICSFISINLKRIMPPPTPETLSEDNPEHKETL